MYNDEFRSLQNIADEVGVCRSTITALAREYGIALRSAGVPKRHSVDRDWLYQRYIVEHRTLADIAAECGISVSAIARLARVHGIPVRTGGGPSHRAYLDSQAIRAKAPKLLWPALDGAGGWERLQRFAAATQYPTLTIAAKQMGARNLVIQKLRLEADLGVRLFNRALRNRPMTLTIDGHKVLAAVRGMQATSHLPSGSDPDPWSPPSTRKASRKAHRQVPDR